MVKILLEQVWVVLNFSDAGALPAHSIHQISPMLSYYRFLATLGIINCPYLVGGDIFFNHLTDFLLID